jgi:hypothetical protein
MRLAELRLAELRVGERVKSRQWERNRYIVVLHGYLDLFFN